MYLALYRKYRPRTFDDVISQEHITVTLKNQIISGQTAHAYLFTGSRGTGKTTCAKILAMAMNCLSPKDGNPCLECERCREILDGSCTDIVEMDAASNNGVDDVRRLRDEVSYAPVSCKYRVYIIDEVHMLSVSAFNALLKTLEEPPEHVKFILATTELHKVLPTISSRCQRFEFRRIDVKDSAERLKEVAARENVKLDDDAAELISRLSDGGMRDALSILDRCVSANTNITAEIVRDCAGVADDKYLYEFSEMIAGGDTAGCIRLLGELYSGSKDLALIVDELSGHYRDLMLCKSSPNSMGLLNALPNMYDEIKRIAELYTLSDILRCLSLLQQCADSIGKTRQRKTVTEMCFVKMCTGEGTNAEYSARPSVVETPKARPVSDPPLKPRPDTELSAEARAKIQRTREIRDKTSKLIADAPPPVEDNYPVPEDYVPPPASPQPFPEPPPITEEPPPFAGIPSSAETRVPNTPFPDEQPPDTNTKSSVKEPENLSHELNEITQQQWENAAAKTKFPTSALLKGSKACIENGLLVITSSNKMLLNNVKDEELTRLENDISQALEARVRIEIRAENETSGTSDLPLDRLLEKARGAGIDVSISD